MDKAIVRRIAAVAVPRHRGIVLEAVEPAADECIANLDLVIEETEGKPWVHGLDPQRETSQFDGQYIQIDAIQTALDDMAA
jgi:hypothetical protein